MPTWIWLDFFLDMFMVSAESYQAKDMLYQFMTAKLKLTPFRVFVAILIVGLIDEILIGYLTGHWNSTAGVLGAKDDYPHWIVSFIFQPAVWAFFLWLLPATVKVFNQIETEAIPEEHVNAYQKSQAKFRKITNAPWISWLSILVGVILVVASFYFTSNYDLVPWTYYLEWHRYSIWSLRLLAAGYFFSFSVVYSILIMVNLNMIFDRFGVRLSLYHGDNVAGLKFIGDFVVRLNQLALVSLSFLISDSLLALQVGQGIWGQTNLILEFIAFPVIILFSFFAPLISCRRAMREAKIRELNSRAIQINASIQLMEQTDTPSKEQVDELIALIDLRRRLMSDIPTLPVDTSGWRTFSVAFIISLIPAFVSVILELINFLAK